MAKNLLKACLLFAFLVCLVPGPAMADTLTTYFNNFDDPAIVSPGVTATLSGITTTTGVQGFAGFGPSGNQFGGNFLRNDSMGKPAASTILTLTGLPVHSSIDINFLFGAIDSWDSDNGSVAPDYFNVEVDGIVVFQPTFAIASGTHSYPNGLLHSGTNLGFGYYADDAYDMGQAPELHNLTHTASTLTIKFFASGNGWQGDGDESWAIENVQVDLKGVNPIPLPPTVLLLGSGLLSLAGFRFRRNQA